MICVNLLKALFHSVDAETNLVPPKAVLIVRLINSFLLGFSRGQFDGEPIPVLLNFGTRPLQKTHNIESLKHHRWGLLAYLYIVGLIKIS